MVQRIRAINRKYSITNYRICTNCVMDTTDSKITFDSNGVCDFCNDYYDNILPGWKKGEEGKNELKRISREIRRAGKGKKYDCIIGMSGGGWIVLIFAILLKRLCTFAPLSIV